MELNYKQIEELAGGPVMAVIFGVGHLQGLSVLRALGSAGVPVYALGEKHSLGFHSRYTSCYRAYPDPHADPGGFMRVLIEVGQQLRRERKRGVLIPTRDSVVELIAREREKLGEFFICHTPPSEVIANCASKEAQYRLARELGVPVPQTYFDNELDELSCDLKTGRIAFPLILKPKKEIAPHLRRKFRVVTIENAARLEEIIEAATAENISFLIQEVIPGADDTLYTLGSCMSRDGELTAVFTGRKLRQRPPRFGECRVGESRFVEEIVADGEKLLRGLKFFGISQVEYKLDARDGRYKLMEINPRAWSWIGLPAAMGINIPLAFFCDALGIRLGSQPMVDKRAAWIHLEDDLYWSIAGRDGVPWMHLLKGYEQIVEPYLTLKDLKPSLLHLKRASIALARRFGGDFLRKTGLRGRP